MSEFLDALQGIANDVERGVSMIEDVDLTTTRRSSIINSSNIKFNSNVLIRPAVFSTAEEATKADMMSHSGVNYMKAVTVLLETFGGH